MKFFILTLITLSIIYYLMILAVFRKKYHIEFDFFKENRLILDKFYVFGVVILNIIKINEKSIYSKKIMENIELIFGNKYSKTVFKIYYARKVNLIFFISLISLIYFYCKDFNLKELLIFFIVSVLGYLAIDFDIYMKAKEKKRSILVDLPEFINKIILLLNAGLVLRNAWEKIVLDYDENESHLYIEAKKVLDEIKRGISEVKAYENFARRCQLSQINKFVLIIIQNYKKGNKDVILSLRYQSEEAWEMRKNIAKIQGEEAATKFIFPMMMIFIAILILVLTPVIISLNQM